MCQVAQASCVCVYACEGEGFIAILPQEYFVRLPPRLYLDFLKNLIKTASGHIRVD